MLADKMGRKKIFALCTVLALFLFKEACCTLTTLKADIFMSSIKGLVMFSKKPSTDDIDVLFNLTGLNSNSSYFWNIHTFPVNYDTSDRCSNEAIGNSLSPPLSGTNNDIPLNTSSSTPIQTDLKSLLGRSVVLKEGDMAVACATILPDKPLVSAVVNFRSVIMGTVILRQPLHSDQSESILYTDLFHISDGTAENLNYRWEIRSNPVNESAPVENQCNDLGTLFGPSSADDCSQQNQTSCSIGSLDSKLGLLAVGSRKGNSRRVYLDSILPLSGPSSVIGKSMVILDGGIVACANIHAIKEKTVSAIFNTDGVTGGMTFSQKSPFDPTEVEVRLSGLNKRACDYHVHSFPVPTKLDIDSFVCGGDAISGHWNPFGVNKITGPSAGNGTSDQYEVGDLSGKYGTLIQKNSLINTYTDWNLPLFGRNSIVGRTIVIHYVEDFSQWICTNIGYPPNVRTAQAVFKHPVIGQMTFRQVENDPFSDTSIFIELNRADDIPETKNHNFHVHVSQREDDIDVTTSCKQAGGHFNPFNKNTTSNLYPSLCSPISPLICEIGDMSLKHSKIDIGSSESISTKYFFTDSSLPLSGPLSIIGRSIVIHGAESGSARIACANIYEQTPLEAVVNSWSPGPVSGSIKFVQATSFDKTKVNVELNGLEQTAGGYHIHILPILPGVQSPCSAYSVSGHFDPFNISKTIKSPEAGTGTFDKYEVGDLSGKYGRLTNKTSVYLEVLDNNLSMRGRQSILGRSVVIHKEEQNARWVCGNINENLLEKPSAVLYKAQAIFKGDIQGSILLSQVRYEDGNLGDTQVYIYLQNSDVPTKGHPWHIHENPISIGGDCASAGSHYNPYAVNVDVNYDDCHPLNPLRCELGDVSGKHGKYDIGSGPQFYTDVNIPLSEKYSVLGRSIVIHNPGGVRIACADIMAMDAEVVEMQVSQPRVIFDKKEFMATIANLLKTPHWKIGVLVHDEFVSDSCIKVSAYITGPDSEFYKRQLQKYINREPGLLGIYAPCTAVASRINMSISVLFFLLTLNWISRS